MTSGLPFGTRTTTATRSAHPMAGGGDQPGPIVQAIAERNEKLSAVESKLHSGKTAPERWSVRYAKWRTRPRSARMTYAEYSNATQRSAALS
jgi:hypothetical protein